MVGGGKLGRVGGGRRLGKGGEWRWSLLGEMEGWMGEGGFEGRGRRVRVGKKKKKVKQG